MDRRPIAISTLKDFKYLYMVRGEEKIIERRDPVCGLDLKPGFTRYQSRVGDDSYYFCSEECKKRFEADPGKYANGPERDE